MARSSLLALVLLYAPRMASACAVCFGGDNKDVARAFTLGAAVLLACTFGLLGGLGYAIFRMERRRLEQDRRLGLLDS